MATTKPTPRKPGARATTRKRPLLKASRSRLSPLRPRDDDEPKAAPAPAKKAPSKRAKKAKRALDMVRSDAPVLLRVEASEQARRTALLAAQAALDKKALDVEIIDVAGKVDYADLLVLMTGTSDRHVASLVQTIEEDLKKQKIRAISVEGMPTANWVLVDFGDVVVHVFQEDARGLYDLGHLWMDATRVPVPARAQGPDPTGGRSSAR